MIKFLRKIYKRRQAFLHSQNLNKNCLIGSDFCTSPLYPDPLLQLLNVKIINRTSDKQKISFGSYCNVSVKIFINTKGSVRIGNYVYMNNGCNFRIDHNLSIGSNCLIGPNVTIWDTSSHPLSAEKRFEQTMRVPSVSALSSYEAEGGDIIIGDNVWIGMDALILGGVTIGQGSIISARSVVTRDVPPMTVFGGIPARKIADVPV